MNEEKPIDDRQWEEGWEGHHQAQLLRWSQLTFRQRLEWLDEAQDQITCLKSLGRIPRDNSGS